MMEFVWRSSDSCTRWGLGIKESRSFISFFVWVLGMVRLRLLLWTPRCILVVEFDVMVVTFCQRHQQISVTCFGTKETRLDYMIKVSILCWLLWQHRLQCRGNIFKPLPQLFDHFACLMSFRESKVDPVHRKREAVSCAFVQQDNSSGPWRRTPSCPYRWIRAIWRWKMVKPAWVKQVICMKYQGHRPLSEAVERKCSCTFIFFMLWQQVVVNS